MPRPNRVTPLGEIVAVPDRGLFMGNRGCLHDGEGTIRRSWQQERWIVCLTEFKGRKRAVMTPGHYTELFFLDEATALAAGHRPCAACRRGRFDAFRRALVTGTESEPLLSAVEIDRQLHTQRVAPDRSKRTHAASLDALPDGVFVLLSSGDRIPYLVLGDSLLAWTAGGYADRGERPRGAAVEVLTPELTVRAIQGGYVLELHPSARSLLARRA
ncbi:MAG TPA: hypothetical protein VGE74_11050 [Gemmata sp.]